MELIAIWIMCSGAASIGFIFGAAMASHKYAEECHRCILLRRRIA